MEQSLLRHGRKINIEQRPRAESDIAVAAASILAREAFINWLERKGKGAGFAVGARCVCGRERKRQETCGNEWTRRIAHGCEGALPNRARNGAGLLSRSDSARELGRPTSASP